MKQKILLVGANGYIGSHLYKKLKDKYNIYPIDNFFRKIKKQKFVIKKDYRDLKEKFLRKFSTCIWLSGHSSVQQSVPDPFGAIDNNLNGLIKFKKISNYDTAILLSWNYKKTMIEKLKKSKFKGKLLIVFPKLSYKVFK